jgi:hypothetical protein
MISFEQSIPAPVFIFPTVYGDYQTIKPERRIFWLAAG